MARRYSPGILPPELPGRRQLNDEFTKLASTIGQMQNGDILERRSQEPERPVDGMCALADGTNWNPGSGRGLYYYDSENGWIFLA